MLGEYNHSVLCYEQALQAQPGFEQALRRKHAVLCQQKLEQRLEAQHRYGGSEVQALGHFWFHPESLQDKKIISEKQK